MANQDAAFGMRPVGKIGGMPFTGGQSRYRIAANYDTAIFQGDMVAQVTGGTVEVHADGGTVPIVGVFNGVQYTDPTTKEQKFSNFYPASTNASDIIAFVIDDPNVIYEIQCNATFPIADLPSPDFEPTLPVTATEISDSNLFFTPIDISFAISGLTTPYFSIR